ncbi:hypothetical protein TRAPUB_8985 [Trametes pubescens]|uniref:Uncharacterized protein n=1 Tax=Trametes pubescens TaxID=154538 RepID=A0A1M2W3N9_TRAPU|nr:hypothetical protein TRAPUB_8985 [Trametes pubescens]
MPDHKPLSGYLDDLRRLKQRENASESAFSTILNEQIYKHFEQMTELKAQWAQRVATVSATNDSFTSRLDALGGDIRLFLRHLEIARLATLASRSPLTRIFWSFASLLFSGGETAPNAETTPAPVGGDDAFNENPKSPQEVIANIQYLLREIEEQKSLFEVTGQVADELIAEFDRYSAALEPLKGESVTIENTNAARLVHKNIIDVRMRKWKVLAEVLGREYARR